MNLYSFCFITSGDNSVGFFEISDAILKGVDYVVDLQKDKDNCVSSTIIKLGNDGTVKVIRE